MVKRKVYNRILSEDHFEYVLFFKEGLKTIFTDTSSKNEKSKMVTIKNNEDLTMIMDYLKIKLFNKKVGYINLNKDDVLPFIDIYTTDDDSISISSLLSDEFDNDYVNSFIKYIYNVKSRDFMDILKELVQTDEKDELNIITSASEEYISSEGHSIEYSISDLSLYYRKELELICEMIDYLMQKYGGCLSRCEIVQKDNKDNIIEYDIILENKDNKDKFTIHLNGKNLISKLMPKIKNIKKDLLLERERRINRREYYYGKFNNGQNS